jgi:hypothetical protein
MQEFKRERSMEYTGHIFINVTMSIQENEISKARECPHTPSNGDSFYVGRFLVRKYVILVFFHFVELKFIFYMKHIWCCDARINPIKDLHIRLLGTCHLYIY